MKVIKNENPLDYKYIDWIFLAIFAKAAMSSLALAA